jgi:NADPH-dependent curcumin reductase CurA
MARSRRLQGRGGNHETTKMSAYQQIILASHPKGTPTSSNFRLEEGPIPVAEKGQVLVRTLYLSLDPYMRGQMNVATRHPIEIGATMDGEVVAEIVQSTHPVYRPGDLVLAMTGWRTHAAVEANGLRRVNPGQTPVTTALGVLGMPGFAAYPGMKLIGQPKEGETVVVAAASGPVGSPPMFCCSVISIAYERIWQTGILVCQFLFMT